MKRFIRGRWYNSHRYAKRTYSYPTLKFLYNAGIFDSKVFNNKRIQVNKLLQGLKNSLLMYSLGNLNLKIYIPYPIKFIFKPAIKWEDWNWENFNVDNMINWYQRTTLKKIHWRI